MYQTAYLLLGGNIGDRSYYLREGMRAIVASCGIVVASSPVYETAAWGKEDQQAFLNIALCIRTSLSAKKLLEATSAIEQQLGRQRTEHWGARTLDIDILFYGNEIIHTDELIIPHPQLQHRRFALAPMADLAPELAHPVLKKTIAALLAECTDPLPVVAQP